MMDVKRLAQIASLKDKGPIAVEKQKMLSWSDAFRISYKNVTIRLGRAAITASGVILGIAFLMSIWTTRVATDGIERHNELKGTSVSAEAGIGLADIEAEKVQRTARQNWLVVMSLLVCMVGITNSMLMSVTERFREIGTMKCLGALDSFIVRLFLIETAVLGFFGSSVGIILGLVGTLIIFSFRDPTVAAKMNWLQMLMYIFIAAFIGVVVSLVAAILPAYRAAKMPPAAALSTEI